MVALADQQYDQLIMLTWHNKSNNICWTICWRAQLLKKYHTQAYILQSPEAITQAVKYVTRFEPHRQIFSPCRTCSFFIGTKEISYISTSNINWLSCVEGHHQCNITWTLLGQIAYMIYIDFIDVVFVQSMLLATRHWWSIVELENMWRHCNEDKWYVGKGVGPEK